MINIYEAVAINKRKSFIIVSLFLVFVFLATYFLSCAISVLSGYEPGGLGMLGLAFIVSGTMTFGSYFYSDKIILSISKARIADKRRDYLFYTIVENLSLAAGVPTPKLYVIEDSAPNAFATGRNPDHAVICVTIGLLEKLNRTELEGVIAHELSHVKNYDILLLSLVSVMVGMIALLADWFLRMRLFGTRDNDDNGGQSAVIFLVIGLVFAVLSPIIGQLIQLAISRRREYMADSGSVSITKQPSGLISALQKISNDREPLEVANKATAHLYIINPFKGDVKNATRFMSGLFNTHPPIAERIKILEEMV